MSKETSVPKKERETERNPPLFLFRNIGFRKRIPEESKIYYYEKHTLYNAEKGEIVHGGTEKMMFFRSFYGKGLSLLPKKYLLCTRKSENDMDTMNQKEYETSTTSTIAAEPVAVYGRMAHRQQEVGERSDIERAITGDTLLERLRPRIKSLFQ